ncbi:MULTISPECIES: hypothetical protein [Burkholderia]|uniref:hypothetical protein n=1 Tax=Burkholderia TaxID=32008 RepID=UPI0011AECFA3|nr:MULTISPECIES: hypothetical protein [unclassified Burkholderia]
MNKVSTPHFSKLVLSVLMAGTLNSAHAAPYQYQVIWNNPSPAPVYVERIGAACVSDSGPMEFDLSKRLIKSFYVTQNDLSCAFKIEWKVSRTLESGKVASINVIYQQTDNRRSEATVRTVDTRSAGNKYLLPLKIRTVCGTKETGISNCLGGSTGALKLVQIYTEPVATTNQIFHFGK